MQEFLSAIRIAVASWMATFIAYFTNMTGVEFSSTEQAAITLAGQAVVIGLVYWGIRMLARLPYMGWLERLLGLGFLPKSVKQRQEELKGKGAW